MKYRIPICVSLTTMSFGLVAHLLARDAAGMWLTALATTLGAGVGFWVSTILRRERI